MGNITQVLAVTVFGVLIVFARTHYFDAYIKPDEAFCSVE